MNPALPTDPPTDIPLPPPQGKISLVVAVCRVDPKGAVRLARKAFVMDAGGGLEHEAAMVQTRLHQMVSVLGAALETHGWSARAQGDEGDSGEGSPL